jgi:outer membrane protein assembly factor BamB
VAGGVPIDWSETKNIAWKTRVPGLGWSSPVVSGNRVWLTTSTGERDVSLRAVAYDVVSGSEIVNVEVFRVRNPRDINPKNSWASPTPVVDGEHVFVHFGADGTAALTNDGKIVWSAKFPYESQHGAGGSPILYGDSLILSGDGPDRAFVVALEKRTGKVKWKTNRRFPHDQAYTTPLVIRVGDRDQLISIGAFRVGAYDPLSGKEIWRANYADGFSNVPRPVFGHGLVYVATGFQQPSLIAVRPDGTGDVTRTHIAWELKRGAPLTPSPILIGDELFVINDGGILSCVDAKSGNVIWQQRLNGTFSASPIFVDGRVYFSSEQGVTTVLVPGKEFRRAAINALDGAILASIAVAEGSFFIRTDTHLYRIQRPVS